MLTNSKNIEGEKKRLKFVAAVVIVVAAIVAMNFLTGGTLLSLQNIMIMLSSMTLPTLIALGFTFIFVCNITDLSPGAIVILVANVAGLMGNAFGIWPMLIVSVCVGILCGLLNFTIYRFSKIPPWIAGLGMTMIYEAIMGAYSASCTKSGRTVVNLDVEYRIFGQRPVIFIVLIVGVVIAYIIYNKTTIGVNMRACGCNETISSSMGINVTRTLILGGVVAGVFLGLAGVVKEGYAAYTPAQSGLTSLSTVFQPMAAALLAKTLSKFMNRIIAVPVSAFIIVFVFNFLTLMGGSFGNIAGVPPWGYRNYFCDTCTARREGGSEINVRRNCIKDRKFK